MKAGWEVKTLGEVTQKLETVDPRKQPLEPFTYIDVSSVSKQKLAVTEVTKLFGNAAPSRARRMVRTGDTIFATIRPTLKRIAHIGSEHDQAVCSTGYMVLRPISILEPRFMYYYLQSANFSQAMEGLQKGASYPAVTDAEVRSQPIPLPPLEEQKRIVSILDEAFEGLDRARENAEANLKSAGELFDVTLQSTLSPPDEVKLGAGWESKTLGDVATLQRGFDLPKKERMPGRYPLVTSSGATDTHDQAKVTGPGVVTGRSGSIGNVFYIDDDFWPLNTALYVKAFHNNNERFVWYLLQAFDLSRFASGTGVPTLNRNHVHSERVVVPSSLDEQKRIVSVLDALSQKNADLQCYYQTKLQDISDLRQSLLQKAFAGELT